MKSKEVLKKRCEGKYEGYVPQNIWEHSETPFAWDSCKALLRIPKKITYFFDRSKITEIRKSNCFKNDIENFYLMKLIDGTFLEVEY